MKTKLTAAVLGLGMLGVADLAIAAPPNFRASLDGYQAVQPASLSLPNSTANATFRVNGNSSIDYQVTYNVNTADTVFTVPTPVALGPVTQIHLHFGRPGTNGGVIAFLCSNLGNAPLGTPACPTASGTVSGTWTFAEIVGPDAQGIAPGQLSEVIAAIRDGSTYVCVHTPAFPAGSIRGVVVKGG